jgi:enamine deaminase RidA (YjgF/YER057c/UK114 family)
MKKHASFIPAGNGIEEHFFTVTAPVTGGFAGDLEKLMSDYAQLLEEFQCLPGDEFLLRFHLSDPANQEPLLREKLRGREAFISVVGQPPAGSRIALESWCWKNWRAMKNYTPYWFRTDTAKQGSFAQTAAEFAELDDFITGKNLSVELNTVRTWLYCKDVDNNYAGLVKARNEYFATRGMTAETHFITSTGIAGECGDPHRVVRMDSLSFDRIRREQIQFLYALENLSPTAIYGVSFERGTRMIWGDRSHFYISGTASIDSKGEVLHPGDVRLQTRRLLENIRALLAEGGAGLEDVKWGTLYLRSICDAEIACEELRRAGLPAELPLVVLQAPVCRPAWLVEMECVAVKAENNPFPILG